MLRFIFITLVLIALMALSAVGVLWYSIEDTPRVAVNGISQLDNADHVDGLMKQVQRSITERDKSSQLNITETQLDSLKGLFQRASIKVSGDATLNEGLGILQGTFAFEHQGQPKYINAEVWVVEGPGFTIDKIKVGKVTVPGWAATQFLEMGVNLYTRSSSGSELLNSVQGIDISPEGVIVFLNPLAPLLTELRRIDTGTATPRELLVEAQTAKFLRTLENYERRYGTRARSLNDYLQVVFAEAAALNDQTNADAINEAAILSLAVFAGHYRIGTFVGDVQLNVDKPSTPNHMPTLAGRVDLSQHFIISAALKILSKQGLSLAIGEFKELMDRAQGGSGYSFVDLAADRAGVKFAVEATKPEQAFLLQQRIAAGMTEVTFFPSIDGLIEGLDKQAFTARFGSVDSPAYKKEVNKIKRRVHRLPLYEGLQAQASSL